MERCEHILEMFRQYHCLGLGGWLRMKVRKKYLSVMVIPKFLGPTVG